jgi:hypothetical protein
MLLDKEQHGAGQTGTPDDSKSVTEPFVDLELGVRHGV